MHVVPLELPLRRVESSANKCLSFMRTKEEKKKKSKKKLKWKEVRSYVEEKNWIAEEEEE